MVLFKLIFLSDMNTISPEVAQLFRFPGLALVPHHEFVFYYGVTCSFICLFVLFDNNAIEPTELHSPIEWDTSEINNA